MADPKKFVEDNPKLSMLIVGVVLVFILILMSSRSEAIHAVPSVKFLPAPQTFSERKDSRFFFEDLKDPRFFTEDLTRPTFHPRRRLQMSRMATPTVRSNPAAPQAEGFDSDSVATEHMLARGGAERAITDSSRTRYLGLAKLGAADYEGYVFQGGPLSDEQGELTATVYGINESPWEALRR